MSNLSLDFSQNEFQPLAARMRPETLKQYIGQRHLLAEGKPLPRAIEAGHLHSMILWGPPGTGKTTLAELIGRYGNADVERISAVTSGIKEIRELSCSSMKSIALTKVSKTLSFRISKTAPSRSLVLPRKTLRLSSILRCFHAPEFTYSRR